MNSRVLLLVIASALAYGTDAATAALLFNGNLDSIAVGPQTQPTPVGWSVKASFQSTDLSYQACSSEAFANVLAPGGYGLVIDPEYGVPTNKLSVFVSQIIAGTPGVHYTLTGWAGAGPGYIGLTDPTVKTEFRLSFLDFANRFLGGVTLNLAAAGLGAGTATPPATNFGYHPFTLSAIAPSNTRNVIVAFDMENAYVNPTAGGASEVFVVDSLSLVPEPSAITFSLAAGFFLFRWRKSTRAG